MFAVCRSTEEESGRIDPPNPIKRGRRRASSLAYRSLMNAIFSRKNPAHLHTGVGGGGKEITFPWNCASQTEGERRVSSFNCFLFQRIGYRVLPSFWREGGVATPIFFCLSLLLLLLLLVWTLELDAAVCIRVTKSGANGAKRSARPTNNTARRPSRRRQRRDADQLGLYRVLPGFTGFYWVLLGKQS